METCPSYLCPGPQPRHRDPECTLTLRQGIAELRQNEGTDDDISTWIAPDLLRDVEIHDAIHVLFACSTDVSGEIIAHVWTAVGTTARMSDRRRVNAHEDHRKILAEIGHGHLLRAWLRRLPAIVATLWRSHRMKRRWPVEKLETFLDRPLCEIRREFGIRLPTPGQPSSGSQGAALRFVRGGSRA